MNFRIRFHGAAQEVTGSMHLIEYDGRLVALDCGLFQGRRKQAESKNRSFPCDPKRIDAVVLSHAHIDHCGKLPRLVREGFTGTIYATPATCDLVRILLADSAHIQEEDAQYWNKKRVRHGDAPIEPLYTLEDVDETVRLLQPHRIGETFEVVPDIHATYHEALAILRDPAPLPECDYFIGESTYGGRETPEPAGTREKLAEIINSTVKRGGKIIIPAFAVGRTQVIAYYYNSAIHDGLIDRSIPLIVDSPLASRATDVFRQHPEDYDEDASKFRKEMGGLFRGKWCDFTENVEDSKALHARKEPMIIVSASGMCEVGRILHHLKNNIADPRSTVIIVGYQAAHTLGRRIVEKQKRIKIFGEEYEVRARVEVLNGFSGHADSSDLVDLYAPLAHHLRRAFLVHGENDQQEKLASKLRDRGIQDVEIPNTGDTFDLT
jgi:metallo-beta-lactamase family protein